METFNGQDFINKVNNIINRVYNMKDKVKALKILDKFEEENEEKYYISIYGNDELWDKYTDITIKWQEIYKTLTEKELERYSNSLPDEMLDINWSKNTREVLQSRIKEAQENNNNKI